MEITVRFFASLRELAGVSECQLALPEKATLCQVVAKLLEAYPALDGHEDSWHFAVNQTHAEMDSTLSSGDRVAIFPYVAGG